MSGISSATAIAIYLNASKNEQTQVAAYVKSTPMVAQTASTFESSAATLGSSAAILANYKALQVLTGAYNMSGQINSRAILSDLMTQSADSTGSLVQETGSLDYLHFARATQQRSTQTATLGDPDSLSLSATGTAASTLTMQNTAWSGTAQTKALPGVQWSFVLNDGSAAGSIAAALNAASTANGGSGGYGVDAQGVVTGPAGAAAISTSTDSDGNTTYSLPVATDDTGAVTKRVDVVSVNVSSATDATGQLAALAGAMNDAGFDATVSSAGALSVTDPATAGTNTLARSFGSAIATATASTLDAEGRLALGQAGTTLSAGQVLTDGSTVIGTVASVDSFGNVTLTAAAKTSIAAGDTIEVATGLGFANVGTTVTTTAATAAGGTTIAFGAAGADLKPGQIVTSGGVTVGTIGAVDQNGNATLLSGSTEAIASGASLVVLPSVSDSATAALSDGKNVSSIVSAYETNAYETSMGQQYSGLDDALYYARTMSGISSISQLMSDSRLLSVVTTAMGMDSYFGELDYDQQVSILTSKLDLKAMTSAAGVRQTAMQFLIGKAADSDSQPTGIVSLFTGGGLSQTDLLGLINGVQSTDDSSGSSGDPILSLFT